MMDKLHLVKLKIDRAAEVQVLQCLSSSSMHRLPLLVDRESVRRMDLLQLAGKPALEAAHALLAKLAWHDTLDTQDCIKSDQVS